MKGYKILVFKPEARWCLVIAALFDAEVRGARVSATVRRSTLDNMKEVTVSQNEMPLL
jgi:hypothetical protein